MNMINVLIHGVLPGVLGRNDRFELVKTISVDTGSASAREPLGSVSLLISEAHDRSAPKDGILDLRLLVVGQTLRAPFAVRRSARQTKAH